MPIFQSPSRGEEDNRQGAAGDEEIVPGLPPPTPIRGIVPGDCLMDSAEPTREISRVSVKVRLHTKVVLCLLRHCRIADEAALATCVGGDGHRVVKAHGGHNALNIMIAVLPLIQHLQCQIQLGIGFLSYRHS